MKFRLRIILVFLIAMMSQCDNLLAQLKANLADSLFYEAKRQEIYGNMDSVFYFYQKSLEANPESPPTLYNLAIGNMYYLANDSLALKYLNKAIELAPENYWYREALVRYYVKNNKLPEAIKVLEEIQEKYPSKTEVLQMLESLYSNVGDYDNVVKVLNKIELRDGKSEELSREKFRIYTRMHNTEKAFKEIDDLINEYPNDLRYLVLKGDCYLEQGNRDKALEIYKSALKQDSTNINAMISLVQFYEMTNQDSLEVNMLEKIATHSLDDINRAQLCVAYMINKGSKPEDVKRVLRQIIKMKPDDVPSRTQMLVYAIQDEDEDEITNVCQDAIDYGTDDPVFYYYRGITQFRKRDYKGALDSFKNTLSHQKKDTKMDMIVGCYSIIGDLYHEWGDYKNAYLAYDTCLLYRPEEIGVLNNYAYYLSLQKKDLDRAAEMSLLSLKKDSTNATYIDTYAWILFQMKRYKEAKIYIDNALEIMMRDSLTERDANVIEHAGDIYSKCGDINKAIEYWHQSLSLKAENSAIINKKIKKKKYVTK